MSTLPLFGSPQTQATKDDYYTPEWVFDAMGLRFDIDVCAPPSGVPWVPADQFYTKADDGLLQPWVGRVWMNPPYSEVTPWVQKFVAHRHGVCLLPMAKSLWFFQLWQDIDAIAIAPKRIIFHGDGDVSLPVFFAAFGPECVEAIGHLGTVRRAA